MDVKYLITDAIDSRLETDLNNLQDILDELDNAESNGEEISENRLSDIRHKLDGISERESDNCNQYRHAIERLLDKHKAARKWYQREEAENELANVFSLYCLSMTAYIIAERIISDLSETDDFAYNRKKNRAADNFGFIYDEIRKAIVSTIRIPKRNIFREPELFEIGDTETLIKKLSEQFDGKVAASKLLIIYESEKKEWDSKCNEKKDSILRCDRDYFNQAVTQIEFKRARQSLQEVEYIVNSESNEVYYRIPMDEDE